MRAVILALLAALSLSAQTVILPPGFGGDGQPGGSGTQLQHRVNGTTFGGVSGSSWDGTWLGLPNLQLSDVRFTASGGVVAVQDQTPTTGETVFIVKEGDGQGTGVPTFQVRRADDTLHFSTGRVGNVFRTVFYRANGTAEWVLDQAGTFPALRIRNASGFRWTDAADPALGSSVYNLSISRDSDGVLRIGDGGPNANGRINLAGIRIAGAAPAGYVLHGNGTDFVPAQLVYSDSATIVNPTTGDTNKYQWAFGQAVTLTRVWCSTDTGTLTIQLDERAEATPNTTGANMLASALVCDDNTESTASFSNATAAQYAPINLQVTAASGSPEVVRIHVAYTID